MMPVLAALKRCLPKKPEFKAERRLAGLALVGGAAGLLAQKASGQPSPIGNVGPYPPVPDDGISDSSASLQTYLNTRLAAGGPIVIPPGIYRVTKAGGFPLTITGAANIRLMAYGTTFLLDGATSVDYAGIISASNCVGLSIEGCTIDYKHLPYSVGVCSVVGATTVTFTMDTANLPFSWTTVQDVFQINSTTNVPIAAAILNTTTPYAIANVSGNSYAITMSSGEVANFTVGLTYIIVHQYYSNNAITLTSCKQTSLQHIKIYSAAGSGLYAYDSTDIDINDFIIQPNPSNSGRRRSITSDGLHFSNCRGFIRLRNSIVDATGDDSLNVQSNGLTIVSVSAPSTFTATVSNNRSSYVVGDTIEFLDATNTNIYTDTITAISGLTPLSITVSGTLPGGVIAGIMAAVTSACPRLDVDDSNWFRSARGNGVVAQCRDTQITGARFKDIFSAAIALELYGTPFFEEEQPARVSVTGNLIENVSINKAAISLGAITVVSFYLGSATPSPAGAISDIVVNNNVIRTCSNMGILSQGVSRFSISGNVLGLTSQNINGSAFSGWGANAIVLNTCSNGSVSGNIYIGGSQSIIANALTNVEIGANPGLGVSPDVGTTGLRSTGSNSFRVSIGGLDTAEFLTAASSTYRVRIGAISTGAIVRSWSDSVANVPLLLSCHGSSGITFSSFDSSRTDFQVLTGNTVVNNLTVTGAPTAGLPLLSAVGSDTNVPIQLTGKGTGSVVVGTKAALATTATGPFMMIPFGAGPPTGVPANSGLGIAQYYDTTNNKIWFYNGSWRGVAVV